MSTREQVLKKKDRQILSFVEQVNGSDALFFTEYRGLSVQQLETLRSSLRQSEGAYRVIKNTLIKRAFDHLNIDCPSHLLKGPTAMVVSKQDAPAAAASLYSFLKTNNALVVKGGYLDGAFISVEDVKALSKLPSKEVLIGQLVGGLQSTISRFVMGLSAPIRGLVCSLDAVKNKKN